MWGTIRRVEPRLGLYVELDEPLESKPKAEGEVVENPDGPGARVLTPTVDQLMGFLREGYAHFTWLPRASCESLGIPYEELRAREFKKPEAVEKTKNSGAKRKREEEEEDDEDDEEEEEELEPGEAGYVPAEMRNLEVPQLSPSAPPSARFEDESTAPTYPKWMTTRVDDTKRRKAALEKAATKAAARLVDPWDST